MIDITVQEGISFPEKWDKLLRDTVAEALAYEGIEGEQEVSILICDEEEIHRLNLEFREIDRPTDVLSFPLFEEGELGDIVISLPRALQQAEEYGHSTERELAFLTAHSVLHLLGYDHENGETEMFEKQEEILGKMGLVRE